MPKLYADPWPLSSSSSEPNISKCYHSSLCPPMCRWVGGTFKARKSESKRRSLTEESLREFNRRIDARSCRRKIAEWSSGRESPGNAETSSSSPTTMLLRNQGPISCCQAEGSGCANALASGETERLKEEQGFNWATKYQPKALKDFICHQGKANELLCDLVRRGQLDHYIFEGPPRVGKRTMARAMIREVLGPYKIETREEFKEFKLEGGPLSSIQVNMKISSQHIEVDVSELKWYAADVVMELVKEIHTILLGQENMQFGHQNDHAIILHKAEKLSADTQLRLRSLLESITGSYKIIFCSSYPSKLQHLRSLCSIVDLLPPSNEEIVEVLEFIAKKEAILLPRQLAENIAEKSQHSLQQAIRSFEATWQSNYPFREDQVIMTGWEDELKWIAKDIQEEQSPKQLYNIREKLVILEEHNVSPEFIFSALVAELRRHFDDEFQLIITALCHKYNIDKENGCLTSGENINEGTVAVQNRLDGSMSKNSYLFMRIEEFIAKIMSVYKSANWKKRGEQNA